MKPIELSQENIQIKIDKKKLHQDKNQQYLQISSNVRTQLTYIYKQLNNLVFHSIPQKYFHNIKKIYE